MTISSVGPGVKAQFAEQGYLHVPSLGVPAAELEQARTLLDGLFDDFAALPQQFAHDLGGNPDRTQPILPEINAVSTLVPALRRTALFRAAQDLARTILGPNAYLLYDHAIYKSPGKQGTTSWHQDSGYDTEHETRLAIWIPFQDTASIDGAMRYVPGSHLGGRREHLSRVASDGKSVEYLEVADGEWVDVPCVFGGATLHDFHTVHGSGPNLGNQVRKAWILDFGVGSLVERSVWAAKEKVRARRYAVR